MESILTVPLFLAEISAKRMQKEQRPASHQLNVKLLVAARSFAQRTTFALSQVHYLKRLIMSFHSIYDLFGMPCLRQITKKTFKGNLRSSEIMMKISFSNAIFQLIALPILIAKIPQSQFAKK